MFCDFGSNPCGFALRDLESQGFFAIAVFGDAKGHTRAWRKNESALFHYFQLILCSFEGSKAKAQPAPKPGMRTGPVEMLTDSVFSIIGRATTRPHIRELQKVGAKKWTFFTNPGTTPITILAVNSDHGLSFVGEETRTMVWVSLSLQIYSTFLNSGGSNSLWSEFWSDQQCVN